MAKNDLLREYRKERKRVRDLVNRMKKRGYIDLDDVIPPIPKKITEGSIRRLKELTPRKLQEKARYVEPETSEIVSGRKGRLLERKKATEKGKETKERKRKLIAEGWTFPGKENFKPKKQKVPKKPRASIKKKPKKEPPEEPGKAVNDFFEFEEEYGVPNERDIIKQRIRDFIDQYNLENPDAVWEARQAFDSAVDRAEAQGDGGQAFYDALKEEEENLANEMDMWKQYVPGSQQYEKHKAEFTRILQKCLDRYKPGSGEEIPDYDPDSDLPLW